MVLQIHDPPTELLKKANARNCLATASGGFTCFQIGGTYFETTIFEKFSKIEKYKIEYLKQIL